MGRAYGHGGFCGSAINPTRIACAALAAAAFATAFAGSTPARADIPLGETGSVADHDTVASALETPARGSVQFAGSGDAPVAGEPMRVLGGTFMAALPLFKLVSFELGGLGYHTKAPSLPTVREIPGETGVGMMAGLRIEVPTDRLRPYATARIAHLFGATDDLWRDRPIENLAGQTSDLGLRHTLGASVGAGLEAPLGNRASWRPVLDIGVRVMGRPTDTNELVVNCQLRFPG